MKTLVSLIFLLSLIQSYAFGAGSFKEDGLRSPVSYDILRRFRQHFPLTHIPDIPIECRSVTEENDSFLGEINPADGKALFENVSPAFVNWYAQCIKTYFVSEISDVEFVRGEGAMWLTPEGSAEVSTLNPSNWKIIDVALTTVKWSDLTAETRKKIKKNIVDLFIGPGVIDNENQFIEQYLDTVTSEPSDMSVLDALFNIIFSTMMQDEFLNF